MTHWQESQRYKLGVLCCERITTYERPKWHREGLETCYRYSLLSIDNERFVYSGKPLAIKVGQYVNVTATIKRIEKTWNCVRLSRPVIKPVDMQNNLPNL